MRVLFYHAGADCLAQAFKDNSEEVIDILLDDDFVKIPFYSLDKGWDFEGLKSEYGDIDIILSNPNCKTYSTVGLPCHRLRDEITGRCIVPKTDLARRCDLWNSRFLDLIKFVNPKYFFIENPHANLKYMPFMQGIPFYMVTYSSYGGKCWKRTDIFTNKENPSFKEPMTRAELKEYKKQFAPGEWVVIGDEGKTDDTKWQDGSAKKRSEMPYELVEHIYNLCKE